MKGICSFCGDGKEVSKYRQSGKLVCRVCYNRELQPKKICTSCGKNKKVAKYEDDKPFCRECYYFRKRDPVAEADRVRVWRKNNPEKYRTQKKRNYAQTRIDAVNTRTEWMRDESNQIVAENRPSDRVLAKELGRSVQAIQIRRSRMKKLVDLL